MSLKLQVIVASTRPRRVGVHVGHWFFGVAQDHPGFDTRLVDLAAVGLPLFDEPRHPRLRQYEHEHTRRWSAIVDEADAYVFVTPEYNFSPPPSLVNALDYVLHEWAFKPAAFVSYGGVSGGLRAVQALKVTMSALRLVPIAESVVVPFVAQHVKEGVFTPNEAQTSAAASLLDALARWAEALRPLRGNPRI